MARETKAQREARQLAEHDELVTYLAAQYPGRLMNLLERATNENFELTVKNGEFHVLDRDNDYRDAYRLTLSFCVEADNALDRLEWDVEEKEQARAERERVYALKKQAFEKLTEEERNALGLNSQFNW